MRFANSTRSMGLITDLSVLVYGLWTIACNLTVWAHGSAARELTWGAATIAVLMVSLAALSSLRPELRAAYFRDLEEAPPLADTLAAPKFRFGLLAILALTLLGHALFSGLQAAWIAWSGALLFAALAAFEAIGVSPAAPLAASGAASEVSSDATPEPAPASEPSWTHWLLHALGLLCGTLSLLALRPRSDDSFYINLGVGVAMEPGAELLGSQYMHGPPTDSLPLQKMFPPYRVHSFEVLGGYISYLTGIEVPYVVHMGLATFASWLAPFALARLFRVLSLRGWWIGVVATLLYYFIEGSAPRGYANQAFVRMFNGKGVMLTVALPLLCAYGLRFGQRPTRLRFGLLALAQITAVGLTSSAIWIAPVLAVLSVTAALDRPWKRIGTLALAVASSGWVLALGLWVKGQVSAGKAAAAEAAVLKSESVLTSLADAGFRALRWATPQVLGDPSTARALLAMTAAALVLAPSVLARRWLAAIVLTLVAFFANPWLALSVTKSITGNGTYERVFWLLPVPIAVGLAFIGTLTRIERRHSRIAGWAVASALLAGFLFVASDRLVLSYANSTELHFPPVLKQGMRNRKIAEGVCRYAKRDSIVLAPEGVSQLLATLHGCGFPLMAGMRWMAAPRSEEQRRLALTWFVGRENDAPFEKALRAAGWLKDYGVDVIVIAPKARLNRNFIGAVRLAGYEKVATLSGNSFWLPTGKKTLGQYKAVSAAICNRSTPDLRVLAPYGILEQLKERGCAQSVLDPIAAPVKAPALAEPVAPGAEPAASTQPQAISDMARMELETATSVDLDIAGPKRAWLERTLRRLKTDLVVMAPAAVKSNRRVQRSLKKIGLKRTDSIHGYFVYERLKEAPEPAPAPAHESPGPQAKPDAH